MVRILIYLPVTLLIAIFTAQMIMGDTNRTTRIDSLYVPLIGIPLQIFLFKLYQQNNREKITSYLTFKKDFPRLLPFTFLTLLVIFVTLILFFVTNAKYADYDLLYILGTTILIPIAEELYFRGIIFNALIKRMSAKKSIILNAFIFGLIHLSAPLMVPLKFLMGFILALIYFKTKNIFYSMLIHSIFNSTVILLMLTVFTFTSKWKYEGVRFPSLWKLFKHKIWTDFIRINGLENNPISLLYQYIRAFSEQGAPSGAGDANLGKAASFASFELILLNFLSHFNILGSVSIWKGKLI